MKFQSGTFRRRDVAAVLGILLLLAFVGREVLGGGLDRNRACADNGYRLVPAMLTYAIDYDENLPPMLSYSTFQQLVAPYAFGATRNVFRCPATGGANYKLNTVYSGAVLGGFEGDQENIELLRDAKPHPDGKTMVAFLDGHVERGGIDQAGPNMECVRRAKKVAVALASYAQDYEDQLPLATSNAGFREALLPYTGSQSAFNCPATHLPFNFNLDISGKRLTDLGDLSHVALLKDPTAHRDHLSTVAFLDEHVERGGVTQSIPGPPADPDAACMLHADWVANAVWNYAFDHDYLLPPMNDYADFMAALLPYVPDASYFYCPPSNQPFILNTSLDGHHYSDFPAHDTLLMQAPPRGGLVVLASLSGHVIRRPN
jgi:prepilin-type processing-associated H-X9-DG protein